MYRVGYIDDEEQVLDDYIRRLRRRDIELLIAPPGTLQEMKQWIVDEKIKCMLVDYRLSAKYSFNGTEMVAYLNDVLKELPCWILTSYAESSVKENLVTKNNIIDRSVMAANEKEFSEFCEDMIQATEVFDRRMEKNREKYLELLSRKKSGTLTREEEKEFLDVYRVLQEYGEIDDLPVELMKSETNVQLDHLLQKLDELLDK